MEFRRRSMVQRMLAAARLDTSVYEEVEADTTATGEAALVVGIVAIAAAIGGARGGAGGVIGGLISAYLGWLLWSAITYGVGTVLGGTATWGELLRTLGFAQSPGVLFVFVVLPLFGRLVLIGVAAWLLVAGVIAIRQALDFGTGRAMLTAFIGFLAYIFAAIIVAVLVGVSPRVV